MAQIELDVPKQNCEFTRGKTELNVGLVNLCLVHGRNTQYFKQHMAPAHRVIETSIPDQTSTSPTTRWMIHFCWFPEFGQPSGVIMTGTSSNSSMIFQAIYTNYTPPFSSGIHNQTSQVLTTPLQVNPKAGWFNLKTARRISHFPFRYHSLTVLPRCPIIQVGYITFVNSPFHSFFNFIDLNSDYVNSTVLKPTNKQYL